MMEPILLDKNDFDCIGQVAKHCDWDQLCIYIREQQNLSLMPKVGFCVYDKIIRYCQGWYSKGNEGDCGDDTYDVLSHLWHGGRYNGCGGDVKMHFGLKTVLAHWSYGAYIYRHGVIDTPFGPVQKINQDSVPVDVNVLKNLNFEHRNSAEYYFKMTRDYLCSVKSCGVLSECDVCACIKDCVCSNCKGVTSKTLKDRGVRFKTISK